MGQESISIIFPVKRTTGDNLEDRLTKNVFHDILPSRYLQKNRRGEVVETPQEMFRRVADNVAGAGKGSDREIRERADTYYELMTSLAFMTNSPTLMNAGAEFKQLAACFVISPRDDLNSIFDTLRKAAKILQTGGGVGYTFSKLRPRGDRVLSTGSTASGPLSFMRVYDEMCGTLKQGGRRRGAQMAVLRVDHPDIGRFITAKRREGAFSNFNFSAALTDEFLEAVEKNSRYRLINPRTSQPFQTAQQTAHFYNLEFAEASRDLVEENFWRDYAPDIPELETFRGETDLEVGREMTLPARFIWQVIIDGAWTNGEPGLFLIDRANRDHSFDVQKHPEHTVRATNPCGEEPLEEYEACSLGHINLSLIVRKGSTRWPDFEEKPDADLPERVAAFLKQAVVWEELERVSRLGTRFLEDAVTVSEFPLEKIKRKQKGLRNIGLGIMGFAELLIQLGVVYGSEASFETARRLMNFISRCSKLASSELARERGVFQGWEDSKYADPQDHPAWFARHTGLDPEDWPDGLKLRNHHTTMIAPTGTTSMIASTSGGCEPLFDIAYLKDVGQDIEGGDMLVEFNDYFLRVLEANQLDAEKIKGQAEKMMAEGEYQGLQDLDLPEEIRESFITADRISPEGHVRMQAAFQEHVDGAISKTINFPQNADRSEVQKAYQLAVDLNCKGLTVYRVGSREEQVLQRGGNSEKDLDLLTEIRKRYGSLETFCRRVQKEDRRPRCPECGAPWDAGHDQTSRACPECGYRASSWMEAGGET